MAEAQPDAIAPRQARPSPLCEQGQAHRVVMGGLVGRTIIRAGAGAGAFLG